MVDDLGRPLSWLAIPTEAQRGPEDASQRMGKAISEAIHKAGLESPAVARVGLGSAGIIDAASGILVKPVNLKGWDNFPLRDRIRAHCGLPVTLANDANAAAYGEFWVGSGRGFPGRKIVEEIVDLSVESVLYDISAISLTSGVQGSIEAGRSLRL